MQFDTKIALVIRSALEGWQKMNIAAFMASGIAAAFPASIDDPYEDGTGTIYYFSSTVQTKLRLHVLSIVLSAEMFKPQSTQKICSKPRTTPRTAPL